MPVETLEKPKTEAPITDDIPFENENSEEEPTDEEIAVSAQPAKASALDPDFILMFFFAAGADSLDLILDTIGLPSIVGKIIGIILDIGTFAIIGGWMYWKAKQVAISGKLGESLKRLQGQTLKDIQAKITKKVRSRVLRKVLIRMIPAVIIEFLPALGIFTSWSLAVISMLF